MDGATAGRLVGKVALITGAASGIGRATAALFHAEGAKVAATDLNEAGLKALGPDADLTLVQDADLTLVQDVTDAPRWRAVVDEVVAAFGRLDILVNSAGIAVIGNIETTTLADWRKVNAVNAEGTFLGCREAVRAMKETGGGSIVNLSSVAGIIGDASSLAYCASKGAVRLLTKSAALHCARAGYKIRVNSVHPSFAETPMVLDGIARAKNPERLREGLMRAAPMGRMGKAEEVANTILFLASDESSFTTGAEFTVDGGLTAQ
jgi:3(or 17)beta-hydroxysteroid dehydrogenase